MWESVLGIMYFKQIICFFYQKHLKKLIAITFLINSTLLIVKLFIRLEKFKIIIIKTTKQK